MMDQAETSHLEMSEVYFGIPSFVDLKQHFSLKYLSCLTGYSVLVENQ